MAAQNGALRASPPAENKYDARPWFELGSVEILREADKIKKNILLCVRGMNFGRPHSRRVLCQWNIEANSKSFTKL